MTFCKRLLALRFIELLQNYMFLTFNTVQLLYSVQELPVQSRTNSGFVVVRTIGRTSVIPVKSIFASVWQFQSPFHYCSRLESIRDLICQNRLLLHPYYVCLYSGWSSGGMYATIHTTNFHGTHQIPPASALPSPQVALPVVKSAGVGRSRRRPRVALASRETSTISRPCWRVSR